MLFYIKMSDVYEIIHKNKVSFQLSYNHTIVHATTLT